MRHDLTLMHGAAQRGEAGAAGQLMQAVYGALRALASSKLARESTGSTSQTTELVHEAWPRMGGERQAPWQNRAHLFSAAAEAMRRILIDRARRRCRVRRGSGVHSAETTMRVSLRVSILPVYCPTGVISLVLLGSGLFGGEPGAEGAGKGGTATDPDASEQFTRAGEATWDSVPCSSAISSPEAREAELAARENYRTLMARFPENRAYRFLFAETHRMECYMHFGWDGLVEPARAAFRQYDALLELFVGRKGYNSVSRTRLLNSLAPRAARRVGR